MYTAEEVIDVFAAATGARLRRTAAATRLGLNPPFEHLSLTVVQETDGELVDATPGALRRKFGSSGIFAYDSEEALRADLPRAAPDSEGIYWIRSDGERGPSPDHACWIAEKVYGENVLLSGGEQDRPQKTAQWERLDAVLSQLEDRRPDARRCC
jgi:hypothetical protein